MSRRTRGEKVLRNKKKRAKEELRKTPDELEMRVQERIKELMEASEKLHAASLYTRSLIEASLDSLVTISDDGKITDVNKATEEATGFSRDQLIGRDFSDFFTDPEDARKGYRKVFTEGYVRDYPLAIQHKSGKITHVLYNATVYRSEAGEIQGVFAAARDITELKQAEEKLRAASLYARSLIEASLDPLVTISAEGKITDVNKATEDVTGLSREQLIGSDFSDYFTDPKEARKGYRQVFEKGFVIDYPLAIRHKSGKITDILYNATVYRNEAGETQGVFAAARDITERKQAEEALRKAHDELEVKVKERTAELTQSNSQLRVEVDERLKAEQKLEHLNAVLSAIRDANQLIAREKERDKLLKGICDELIKNLGYYNVWIGLFDESKNFISAFESGLGSDFSPLVELFKSGKLNRCALKALAQSNVVVTEDPQTNCTDCPLAKMYKGRSALSARLEYDGSVYGLITASTPASCIQYEEERDLFEELARDVGFALHSIELEENRKKAEGALQKARDELEVRVEERTREFRETGEKLQAEIVDRKQAEEAVKAERKRFIDVLEQLPAYLILLTPDYHVVYANRFFRERFGEDRGKRCFEYLFGRTEPCETCETYKTLKTMSPLEWEWTGPDGHNYYIYDSPFTEPDGSTRILEVGIDITERKKAEEKLHAASLYSRNLIEASLDPLVTISPEGKITDVNKATEEATGFSREQLIGSDFSNYFTEPDNARAGYQKVFTDGFVRDYPLAIRHKSGKIIDVLYNATVYKNEAGQIQGVFAAARDVTERKRAEEKLRATSLYARSLIEASLDPLVTISADGKITDVNKSTEEVTGYSRNQLIGSDFSDYFTNPEEARKGYQQVFTEGFVRDYPLAIRSKDGKIMDVLYNATVYKNELGEVQGVFAAARDITERKHAEEALRKQATLIDLSPDGIIVKRLDGTITFWNLGAEKLYGWTTNEAIGQQTHSLLKTKFPEDKEKIFTKLKLTGKWSGELVHKTKDGTELTAQSSWLATFDKNGEVAEILESNVDITERKKAEEALRKAHDELEIRVQERTKQLAEASEELRRSERDLNRAQTVARTGSWRLDLRSNTLLWSDETYRIFGIPKGTLMTYDTFLGTIHPDDREYVDQKWKAALQGGPYDIEHRIIVNGEVKWVREKAELDLDIRINGLVGGFGTVQDITERKQAEQALQQAKQEWERTFDSVPDLIAILDDQHRIIRANQAMAKQLATTPEQCIGLFCYKCVHGTDQPIESCPHVKTLRDGQEHIEELHEDRLGGDFLVSTTPLRDEQGRMIGSVHVARNITDRKKMEAKLEEYAKHLEELVEEKTKQLKDAERLATIGQTAGMVGHDIRNPLQSIEGATYLAKEELKFLPAESNERKELQEIIELIKSQTDYIDHIVSDLQDFAKPPLPQPRETDIQEVINEALSMFEISTNIQVQTVLQHDLKKQTVDPEFLKRIFINLIENAIQAMPKGGELAIKAFEDEKGLWICVEDTGAGIPEEDKPKIFTPLFTTKAKGQGFGLSVCKKLAEAHNGEITFESEQGKGTKFKIKIPQTKKET